jgi:hypothetical protein
MIMQPSGERPSFNGRMFRLHGGLSAKKRIASTVARIDPKDG